MDEARERGTALGRKLAEELKEANTPKKVVEARVLARKFGGRSLESLVEAERQRLFQSAIESAGRTGGAGDELARTAGRLSKGMWVLTFATAAYSVYVADDRVQELARQSAILGGGALGGIGGGALAGAGAGLATGPLVVIFIAGGAILGGMIGSLGAEYAFDELIE